MSTDRSQVIWEAYPGATNDIDREVEAAGGWVCEQHPDLEWPHDDCAGPGTLRSTEVCAHCGRELGPDSFEDGLRCKFCAEGQD